MRDSFADYYRTGEQVRRGAGWELYRGAGAQGEPVWLLRLDGAADQTHAIRRRADWLREQDWSLTAPRALAPDGRDLVTISEAAAMAPIAERAAWSLTEALRCTASSCAALQAMHEVGLVHGHLDGWLVDADGDGGTSIRGFAELAVVGDGGDRREDVQALGRVLRHAFVGLELPGPVAGALAGLARGERSLGDVAECARRALQGEPSADSAFPAADPAAEAARDGGADHVERDLVASLRSGSIAPTVAPVRRTRQSGQGTGPRPHPRHAAGASRDWPSRLLVPGAVLALVVLVAVVWLRGRGSEAQPTSTPPPATTEPSTSAAADADAQVADRIYELYAARSAAIGSGDRAQLAAIYAPGAAMLAQDEAVIGQLAADGAQVDGFEIELVSIDDVESGTDTAAARVTDRIPAFEIVGIDGVRTVVAGRESASTELTLVSGSGGWVISSAIRVCC